MTRQLDLALQRMFTPISVDTTALLRTIPIWHMRRKIVTLVALALALVVVLNGTAFALNRTSLGNQAAPPVATPLLLTHFAHLAFSGDSLTAGFYATTESQDYRETFIRLLQNYDPLSATGTTPSVAIGGVNTLGLLTYLQQHPDLVPGNIDLYVVELGTNDYGAALGAGKNYDQVLATFRQNYGQLLKTVLAKSPNAALVCVSVWGRPGGEPSYTGRPEDFNAIIKQSCASQQHDDVYVDITQYYLNFALHGTKGTPTFSGPSDTFHPNDAGHKKIAETIFAAVKPLLAKPSSHMWQTG